MELLEKIGDKFNAATEVVDRTIRRFFGTSTERFVRDVGFVRDKSGAVNVLPGSPLDRINSLEPDFEKQSDSELKETASRLRQKLAAGKTLDDLLPEAFAAVRESAKRYLKMRHYDVQMVGGHILHKGMIAEMATGEGKTLVATLPSFLNALGGSVHVVTVNDYLARRDMEWMGPTHIGLGLTVGTIQSQMNAAERQKSYSADITYGTNNEFGFDYLRDNMKPTRALQVQGPLNYAIVDEIDNILIDEARTPLIISGPAYDDVTRYMKAHRIAVQLKRDEHFEVKEKEHTCHLTEDGVRHAEGLAGVDSFYTAGNMEWPHLIDNSLKAIHLYKRDVEYVVENGEIVIVDEHTGRKMHGRQWSDGLHQAVEAKEGVKIKESTQTLATITLQNYFKLYKKLCGMTGTAMTEANEFWKIYKLEVVTVPTNRPTQRINQPDVIYRSEAEKWNAICSEIREVHATGRPILVGTVSVEKSELLARKLDKFGIKHQVLNAKYHEREAEIISQAGRKSAVTISTNMAGRGTDIILGGNPEFLAWQELSQTYPTRLDVPKAAWDEASERIAQRDGMRAEGEAVKQAGGLYVIGSERHDARRIDLQLRGRAGRQGDPGSSRFFISLEDDLMRIFGGEWVKGWLTRMGMQEGESIENGYITNQISKSQKRREEYHFEQRKHLLDYDEVMDEQRKKVYGYRQRILDGFNCRQLILDMMTRQIKANVNRFLSARYRWETLAAWAGHNLGIELDGSDLQGMAHDQVQDFLREQCIRQSEDLISEQIEENLPDGEDNRRDWNYVALSRWINSRYGLNTNDRELRKFERHELHGELANRARGAIERVNLSVVDEFLRDDFEHASIAGWITQQFGIPTTVADLAAVSATDLEDFVLQRVRDRYREQEVRFPVTVGMTRFMPENNSAGTADRDGFARWAQGRFGVQESPAEAATISRADLEQWALTCSRRFFEAAPTFLELSDQLRRDLPDTGREPVSHKTAETISQWLGRQYSVTLPREQLENLKPSVARDRILEAYDKRYRPELSHTERSLVLEVLDTAWKEHLHYMDHLRSGIGLVGYAQQDPKVEYKRKGMSAFEEMWDRIGGQVTSAIFRIEKESPEFVGHLWTITAASHAEYVEPAVSNSGAPAPLEPGQVAKTVEPIRNTQERVGRNDPCPCGSGKKYKNCCGANG